SFGSYQSLLETQNGNDVLDGGAGNDQLVGGGRDDSLFGGDGDDHMWGDNETENDLSGQYHGNDSLHGDGTLEPGFYQTLAAVELVSKGSKIVGSGGPKHRKSMPGTPIYPLRKINESNNQILMRSYN
ncbi:MAG: hypothetical protein J0I63_16035, partial [Thiobacillus sp.]|nr:hypothetical protein [Thiobacillus sp.]